MVRFPSAGVPYPPGPEFWKFLHHSIRLVELSFDLIYRYYIVGIPIDNRVIDMFWYINDISLKIFYYETKISQKGIFVFFKIILFFQNFLSYLYFGFVCAISHCFYSRMFVVSSNSNVLPKYLTSADFKIQFFFKSIIH